MSNLAHRRDIIITKATDNDLQPSSATVNVLPPGGTVVSVAYTTVTVLGVLVTYTDFTLQAGHGFSVGQRFILGTDTTTYGQILSAISTNVLRAVGSYSAAAGDLLVNLGSDTGSSSPNWDDATVPVYSTSDGSGTALAPSSVVTNSEGEYEYWWYGQACWEIARSGSTILDIVTGFDAGGTQGPTSSTDNAVARWDGATGRLVQNSVVTIGDTGNTTGIGTLNASGAATLGSTLAVTGATTLTGALTANGAVSATAAGTGLAVTNNITVGGNSTLTGNLGVSGATTVAALTASGAITANAALQEKATGTLTATSGGTFVRGFAEESVTLSTSGTTTDSVGNILPAGALILAVTGRVTTTITTATDWALGVSGSGTRFASVNSTMTAGSTSVGLNHWQGAVSTDALGPVQTAAAKVRITTTGTPGAGVIRLCVWYLQFTASTS